MKKGLFLSLFIAQGLAAKDYQIHVLKDGETLSEILQQRGYTPLYGEGQWVDKTLKMNHLGSTNAKELKKGFPIILPSKGEDKKEVITKTKNIYKEKLVYTDRSKNGLLSGLISEHQDVYLDFSHQQNQMILPSSSLNQREIFTLGLHVEGKNRNRIGRLIYDTNIGFQANSQGSGTFSQASNETNNKSAFFAPTYEAYTELVFDAPSINFNFGPTFKLQDRSRAFEAGDNSIETRRDRIAWLGFNIYKDFNWQNSKVRTKAGYGQKFLQESLDGRDDFTVSESFLSASLQLTDNYFAGLTAKNLSYDRIELLSEQSIGLEFNYLIK